MMHLPGRTALIRTLSVLEMPARAAIRRWWLGFRGTVPALTRAAIYDLLTRSAGQRGYPVRRLSYYEALWNEYVAKGTGTVLVARRHSTVLGGPIVAGFGDTAYLFHSARGPASAGGVEHMASYYDFVFEPRLYRVARGVERHLLPAAGDIAGRLNHWRRYTPLRNMLRRPAPPSGPGASATCAI